MRTIKALVCAAALAAGLATSLAQSNVYSLNVVGYYNVPCVAGQYVMIANQLNTTNNTLNALLPNGPPNTTVLKWAGGWGGATFDPDDLVWYPNGDFTLNPGEAALVKCTANTTLTFVGEVLQGALSTTLSPGNYVGRSSIVPQAGLVATDLKYVPEPNDVILKWNGGWGGATFDPDDLVFYPSEPTFGVGEGMLIKKAAAGTITAWTRNFTVQ
jgi:hypothetical protein